MLAQDMDQQCSILDLDRDALPFTVNLTVDTCDTSRYF